MDLKELWDLVKGHLSLIGLVLTWVGIALVYLRRRSEWLKKSFLNQVNFSLNYIEDGKLCIRTLLETTASQVWLNSYGINKVFKAAGRTRPDQPFIILPDEEDMGFVKRAVLNVLSEKFADVFLAQGMGLPVKTARFVFAITFENFPDMRTRKFRILLMEVESLKQLFVETPGEGEMKVSEPRHRDRLSVLRAMRDIYFGDRQAEKPILGELELGLKA
jgi:hypothetical protein